jgi:hypothetical protein
MQTITVRPTGDGDFLSALNSIAQTIQKQKRHTICVAFFILRIQKKN